MEIQYEGILLRTVPPEVAEGGTETWLMKGPDQLYDSLIFDYIIPNIILPCDHRIPGTSPARP